MRVFAGKKKGNLTKCGDLVMRNEEFKILKDSIETPVGETPIVEIEFIDEQ